MGDFGGFQPQKNPSEMAERRAMKKVLHSWNATPSLRGMQHQVGECNTPLDGKILNFAPNGNTLSGWEGLAERWPE